MKLQVLDKSFRFVDEMPESILVTIEDELECSGRIYSHLIVDGVEVYQELHDYFENDFTRDIEEIVVVAQTTDELFQAVLNSSLEYLERVIPHIEGLSREFYRGGGQASWSKFSELIDGLQWILSSYSVLSSKRHTSVVLASDIWDSHAKNIRRLQEIIDELLEAIENDDRVLLADLLTYELLPVFTEMVALLGETVVGGGDKFAH